VDGAPKLLGWWRQVILVCRKDLEVELSTGEVLVSSGLFALLVVVVSSMAFHAGPAASAEVAPGVIWVSVAFASVLAMTRSWQRERECDALSGLLVMPLSRSAIYLGKALGVWTFVVAIEILVVPIAALLFAVPLGEVGLGLALLSLAATPGIAASGTLFGAMTVRTGARDLALAMVLFPLLAPALLAAVAGTRALFGGAQLGELGDYLQLMGLFAALFTAGGLALFGTLIEA